MKLGNIIGNKKILTIDENDCLKDAVKILKEKNVGSLIVVDKIGVLQGILSERDILYKAYLEEGSGKDCIVKDYMTKQVDLYIATVDDRTAYAMNVMTKNRIRHLPIFDNDQLVGIVSIGDVVKALMEESEIEAKVLKEYLQSPYGVPIV